MLLGGLFKKATQPKEANRRVDTSSLSGVMEASRKPNIITDIKMGFGLMPEDSSYRARTERTKLRMRQQAQRRSRSDDSPRRSTTTRSTTKPRAPTKEELKRARIRAEGQARRKKFEKEVGKKVAKRRRLLKLINIGTGD